MSFKETIASILEDSDLVSAIADRYGIAKSTVKRWANGVSRPHPVIQDEVIKFIEAWK